MRLLKKSTKPLAAENCSLKSGAELIKEKKFDIDSNLVRKRRNLTSYLMMKSEEEPLSILAWSQNQDHPL